MLVDTQEDTLLNNVVVEPQGTATVEHHEEVSVDVLQNETVDPVATA